MASHPKQSANHNMMGMHNRKMGNAIGMNMGKMAMDNMMNTDLKMLETANDSDFDKAFLAEMIPPSQDGVDDEQYDCR